MIMMLIAWSIAIPVSLVLCYLALELTMGLIPLRREESPLPGADRRLAILVPAHDEAEGIAATITNLRQTTPSARILVVADNCTDETAERAKSAGAEVIKRVDPERHGKGFALAHGRAHLRSYPPDAVLVFDADCRLEPGAAEKLFRHALDSARPVQSAYLFKAREGDSPLLRISNFAFLIKNLVRARGLRRLGGGSLLFGTGMAFPWELFERLPLSTSNAVEDLGFGLWLAKQGIAVELNDSALVTSEPAAIKDTRGQRSRWEHGMMSTALSQAMPLLFGGITRRSPNLVTLGAHLLVPPLSLLVLLTVAALAFVAGFCAVGGNWLPFTVLTAALALVSATLLLAWWREGRVVLSLAMLSRVPFYLLWKIPIYLRFFTNRQKGWNRTRRAEEA